METLIVAVFVLVAVMCLPAFLGDRSDAQNKKERDAFGRIKK